MRIVLDMQGAQTFSRFRGIGRYTLGLSKAIVQNKGQHEIFLVLNAALYESIDDIKNQFKNILPPDHIRFFYPVTPICFQSNEFFKNQAKQNPDINMSFNI